MWWLECVVEMENEVMTVDGVLIFHVIYSELKAKLKYLHFCQTETEQ